MQQHPIALQLIGVIAMNIYSFENVQQYLSELNMKDVYFAKRKWYIETYHESEYDKIINFTKNLKCKSFTEQLYCFCNNISSRPQCSMCNSAVSYSSRTAQYHRYCSQSCSLKDSKNLIGVENASQLESVKQKKRDKSLTKYGVDNVSKSVSVKQKIGTKASERWKKYHQNKDYSQNMSLNQYNHRVQQYSNTQYNRHKHIIDPDNKRGKDWHLDHIYSVSQGYLNNVPVNVIGDITNLRIIPAVDNIRKGLKCDKTLESLYEDYKKSL
jgi:hypothetical protein